MTCPADGCRRRGTCIHVRPEIREETPMTIATATACRPGCRHLACAQARPVPTVNLTRRPLCGLCGADAPTEEHEDAGMPLCEECQLDADDFFAFT